MRWNLDVLVVGAGPAGIAAAVTAAEAGQHVGLVDDNPGPGGQIWRAGAGLPTAARKWLARLDASSAVRLQGWRIFDCPEAHLLRAERNGGPHSRDVDGGPGERQSYAELRYRMLVLATGARERFLPFPGWTLPNVMGAGGLDAMVRGGLPIAGKRVVIAGTGPLLLAVAAHLAARGARIAVVCEQAPLSRLMRFAAGMLTEPAKLWQGAQYRMTIRHTRYLTSAWPIAAHGSDRIESVTLQRAGKQWEVPCDYLGCGFHLVPNVELAELLGCHIEDGFVATDEMLQTSVPGVYCAGEPTGIGGVDLSLLEGRIAALAATGRLDKARTLAGQRRRKLGFVRALNRVCPLDPRLRDLATDDTILCRCEDVRFGRLSERTGWRDAKLHTRCGMGPCQGRICGTAAEFFFGWRPDSVRPPLFPASVSSLASFPQHAPAAASIAVVNAFPENSKETP
jgi:NADPH-dependent 2,4-dienoyl-CoA reductase/sulfur reductase-like enzyme